jgi:hypothetical protein
MRGGTVVIEALAITASSLVAVVLFSMGACKRGVAHRSNHQWDKLGKWRNTD